MFAHQIVARLIGAGKGGFVERKLTERICVEVVECWRAAAIAIDAFCVLLALCEQVLLD